MYLDLWLQDKTIEQMTFEQSLQKAKHSHLIENVQHISKALLNGLLLWIVDQKQEIEIE